MFDSSEGWECEGVARCWSRTEDPAPLTDGTNADRAFSGKWWAYVESSNDGINSAEQDDSNPFKKFVLRSPNYPAVDDLATVDAVHSSGGGARSGYLWPRACDLALAFQYLMYGSDMGNLSLMARGCFDANETICSDVENCDADLALVCPLACDRCGAGVDTELALWVAEGDQGPDWLLAVVEVPTGTQRLEFVVVTGTGDRSDVAIDYVRLAPSPTAAPTSSALPTPLPSSRPTEEPSRSPSSSPTPVPRPRPTLDPTPRPTMAPSPQPSRPPTPGPSPSPTRSPSPSPTISPTPWPSSNPTSPPSSSPSASPGGSGGSGSSNSDFPWLYLAAAVVAVVLVLCCVLAAVGLARRRERKPTSSREDAKHPESYLPVRTPGSLSGKRPPPPPAHPPPPISPPPRRTVEEELRTCIDRDAVMVLDDPAYRRSTEGETTTLPEVQEGPAAEQKETPAGNLDASLPFLDSSAGWPMGILEFARAHELEESREPSAEAKAPSAATPPEEDDWAKYDSRVQPLPRPRVSAAEAAPPALESSARTRRASRSETSSRPPTPSTTPPVVPPVRRSSSGGGGGSESGSFSTAGGRRPVATVIGDFNVTHMIGKGAFGRVLLALKRSGAERGRAFAVKVLDKDVVRATGQAAHTRAERETLAALRHPFVVRLRYAFQSRDRLYLVTDFYAGGSLERHLDDAHPNGLSEKRTLYYSASLVAALRHCHSAGVVHRDIKPGNVLVDARGDVALTDFGLCALGVLEDGAPLRSFCGTVTYMAPELLVGNAYGTSVDWWALGALIFEMASGRPPFEDPNRRRMFYTILNIPPPYPLNFSAELIELLSGLLEKRSERRLGVVRPLGLSRGAPPAPSQDSTPTSAGTSAAAPTPQELQQQLQQQKTSQAANASASSTADASKSSLKPPRRRSSSILGNLLSRAPLSALAEAPPPPPPPPPEEDSEAARLGRGDDPIKNAAYFSPVDWIALVERRLTAPWIPSLSAHDDVAYVPKRVRDRRSSSIRDEFGGDELVQTGRAFGGGEARISRQTASLSSQMWGDFSYVAPARGETIRAQTRSPRPVAVSPAPAPAA